MSFIAYWRRWQKNRMANKNRRPVWRRTRLNVEMLEDRCLLSLYGVGPGLAYTSLGAHDVLRQDGAPQSSASRPELYVDQNNNSGVSDGTAARPFTTVQAAATAAPA